MDGQPVDELRKLGVEVVSSLDVPLHGWNEGQWGTFRLHSDGATEMIASPYCDWGTFYVQFARSILGEVWDGRLFGRQESRAVN